MVKIKKNNDAITPADQKTTKKKKKSNVIERNVISIVMLFLRPLIVSKNYEKSWQIF